MPLVNIYIVNIHLSNNQALHPTTKSKKSEHPQQHGVPLRLFDGPHFHVCRTLMVNKKRTWNVQFKQSNRFFSENQSREKCPNKAAGSYKHLSKNANLKGKILVKHLCKELPTRVTCPG